MSSPRFVGLLLALITLVVYLPSGWHDFVNYDDNDYVTDNLIVQNGLTWAGIQWAFTTGHASNWHPLTWLSHMLDCQLFGLNPGAHHLTNVLLHTANSVLLLLLLLRLTSLREDASARQAGALWPSALVAALFAWHPLHVESVAWIAERKDVLSTCFALLSLLAYVRFVKEKHWRSYWLALIYFVLGLMAKPMLVTLPCVMLLLDYWPLQRLSPATLREKWPFFGFTVLSCIVTYLAQQHGEAVMTLAQFPFNLRLVNALLAYGRYLSLTVWPVNLAVLYPLPSHLGWLTAGTLLATALLAAISWLAWRKRRECPYLLVGWLWFLGTLVPVIGIVQVGKQSMADRYTYLPSIGVFIIFAYGLNYLTKRFQLSKIVFTVTALALAGCIALTENQLSYWRNSESLFRHAIAVTKNNYIAHLNLGGALQDKGDQKGALAEYQEALQIAPQNFMVHGNIASVLDDLGRPQEAIVEYEEALKLYPAQPKIHDGLGIALVEMNQNDEAMNHFAIAASLNPTYPWPHFQMGKTLLKLGRDVEAVAQFREAVRLDPDNFQILAYTAKVLSTSENPAVRDGQTALMYAARANSLTDGAQLFVLDSLGMACAETGDFTNAQVIAQQAIELAVGNKSENLDSLRQRLELYQNHQPYRESFTNTLTKDFRNN